uniref:mitogen-activated protein kinase kinase n=1 Tax=Noctiluca scintillans TaxID=2966 RepID=A0A7S1FIZ3_NOCSC|mmetsp:Transcript_8245/g.22842  ORF Transcript_8245/g.22842 Transcript_8245/m.22842 type:complete len:688 (+) Transcript_8245:119-2182(+)
METPLPVETPAPQAVARALGTSLGEASPAPPKVARPEKKRPKPLSATFSKAVPQALDPFVGLCTQWGGVKGTSAVQRASDASPKRVGDDLFANSPTASPVCLLSASSLPSSQLSSEGASTTASSTSECFDVDRPEDTEYICKLGQGSSGTVYKHRHIRTAREVAIKVITAADIGEAQRKAILLELRTCAKCRSPHIVDFYGAFYHETNIHIALEYMDAGALSTPREKRQWIPERLLSYITWQVLDGLEYLHSVMHVIHRDLKPSNLLLSSSGVIKIADFGVSGELEDDASQAEKLTWVGTTYYMSPERVQRKPYRYDSDMWSLGITLIECISGLYPYADGDGTVARSESFWKLMDKIVKQDAPRLPSDKGHSVDAQDFIQQVVQKEPRNRPSAAMMKTHAWIGGSPALPKQVDEELRLELASWIRESIEMPAPSNAASSDTLTGESVRGNEFDMKLLMGALMRTPTSLGRQSPKILSPCGTPSSQPPRSMEMFFRDGGTPRTQLRNGEPPLLPSGDASVGRGAENPFHVRDSSRGDTPMAQSSRGDNPFHRPVEGLCAGRAEDLHSQTVRGANPFSQSRGGDTLPAADDSPNAAARGVVALQIGTSMANSLRGRHCAQSQEADDSDVVNQAVRQRASPFGRSAGDAAGNLPTPIRRFSRQDDGEASPGLPLGQSFKGGCNPFQQMRG